MHLRLLEGETTDRIEALSDGVFAIVLTLLVLQFEVPETAAADLPAALADQRSLLFSYLVSFAVVGIYWIVHHNLFGHLVRHDRALLYLNLLFLLLVSFLPYPTELLGVYGTAFTWTLYALNLTLVGLSLTAIWWYAFRRGFADETIDRRLGRALVLRGLIAPAVFVLSIGVAAAALPLAFLTPILIAPLQALWARRYANPDA